MPPNYPQSPQPQNQPPSPLTPGHSPIFNQYPPASSPVPQPRPINDIAPPQNYAQQSQPSMPHNPYPVTPPSYPTSPQASQPNYSSPSPFNNQPARPMSDIAPPAQPVNTSSLQPTAYSPPPPQPTQPPTQPPAFAASAPAPMSQSIPVRTPMNQSFSAPQPFTPPARPPQTPFGYPGHSSNGGPGNDYLMENILKDVNRSVFSADNQPKPGFLSTLSTKLGIHKIKQGTKKAVSQPKPTMVISLAIVALISLSLAAFFAFHDNGKAKNTGPEVKVVGTTAAAGDSIQAGGGTLVSAQEIDDLSTSLKQRIGGFNDAQDFNLDPLSDQALGL